MDAMAWTDGAATLLDRAVEVHRLSPRGWNRVRRVAVTIADLDASEAITADHVAESLGYRLA